MRLASVLDALFPPSCAGCGRAYEAFCAACRAANDRVEKRRVSGIEVLAGGAYEGPLRRAILACKRGRRDVALALGEWLAERCGSLRDGAILVPIPTTRSRRAERGFDQSVLLANVLSRRRGVPVLAALRRQDRIAQQGRSRSMRLAASDRFECTACDLVQGVDAVLFDDVVTTGATLVSGAKALRGSGALVRGAITLASAS